MKESRTFEVLGKPQAKQRPRFGRYTTYTPKETLNYENLVKFSYAERYADSEMMKGELDAYIKAYMSIPKSMPKYKRVLIDCDELHPTKKPDLDNIAKSILDALNGIAYKDDSAIVSLHVSKHYSDEERVEVTLCER